MAQPKLTYFPAAGRTWGLRIAMFKAFGKDGWVDERIQFSDWKNMKPNTPLGSLPILTFNGHTLTQCDALTRWAGKQAGLYPSDAMAAFWVDEAMTTAFEALNNTPGRGLTTEEKKKAREAYAEGFLSTALLFLESRVGAMPFLTGDDLTIGDLTIVMLTDMICLGDFDFVSPSLITDKFPGLAAHRERVKNHELVKDYDSNYDTENHYHKP